jgi:cytochrome c556
MRDLRVEFLATFGGSARRPVWPCVVIAAILSACAWGCGGGAAPDKAEGTSSETAAAPKPAASTEVAEADKSAQDEASDSADGNKPSPKKKAPKGPEIDGIPLDVVWYDDPLGVAADSTAVGGPPAVAATSKPSMGGGAASAPAPTPDEPAPAAQASATGGWQDLISGELIAAETKKIKNRLTDSLSTVGKYNGNYKEVIQVDAAVLSALAQVLQQHPDSLTWKADAPSVRDLAAELGKKAKGLGQASYDPSKEVFDKLDGVLGGNKPPGLEESPPQLPFGEFASRMGLMKRMQKSFDFMKSNIQNEATFKKEAETIQHESALLATLTKVTGAKEYPGGDEEEYQQFIKDLVAASQAVNAASKGESFSGFQDSISQVQKLCDNCHQAYRFGEN